MPYSFTLKVYGCQMNQYDADKIRTSLKNRGWVELSEDVADVVIFVGCSIRDKAEHKVWSELGRYGERWKKERRPFVAVTGCIAQNVGVNMAHRYPWIRLVSGPRHIGFLPDALEKVIEGDQNVSLLDSDPRELHELHTAPICRSSAWKASVMISHGCDNFCTYCIVPYVRGRFASRPVSDILEEIKLLLSDGVKEITLLGQNVDTYGKDLDTTFATLLAAAAELDGMQRLRFMTSYPTDFTVDVVKTIASHPNICPAINLPIQSGSDKILRAMNRHYTLLEYAQVVDCIYSGLPVVGLTSDIIVGFPGETEEDFKASLSAVSRFQYTMVHTAAYSPRQGTPAAKMPDQISEETKNERLNRINEFQTKQVRTQNEKLVGNVYQVLVDGKAPKGSLMQGRTVTDQVVLFPGTTELAGSFVDVKIDAADSWSLKGQIVARKI